MFEKYIDELKPLPILNMKWHNDIDKYSDGDVEDTIVRLLAENEPEEYTEAIYDNFSWPVFYHLTNTRANIVNWYPFESETDVLEIGCGFGAVTNTLCDKCKNVTAVELSEKRATGTLLRCRKRNNLEIIVGNLNDIEFEKKFDYITLIGVLEYQGKYTNSGNPYVDFLKKIKSLLKPNGKLLIAIENQFGIKYWCGIPEDHTGIPFDGMNDYVFSKSGVRTFSKEKLKHIIMTAGYKDTFFYYPMPDYKLPKVIFSDRYIPEHFDCNEIVPYSSISMKTLIAKEENIYNELLDNKVFSFFANSFFVECGNGDELGKVVYAKNESIRFSEYQVGTRIFSDGFVEKYKTNWKADKHLQNISDNSEKIIKKGIKAVRYIASCDALRCERIDGKSMNDVIRENAKKGDFDAVLSLIYRIQDDIIAASEFVPEEDNIMYTFGDTFATKDYGKIVKYGYLDMISRNALMNDDSIIWFDQEWMLENVPLTYVFYRNILYLYFDIKEMNSLISIDQLFEILGLGGCTSDFKKLEALFLGAVVDERKVSFQNRYNTLPSAMVSNNIVRFLK